LASIGLLTRSLVSQCLTEMGRSILVAALLAAGARAAKEEKCGVLKIKVFTDSECKNADDELTKEWQKLYDTLPTNTCNDQGSDAGTSFKYTCDAVGFHTTYFGDETCGGTPNDDVDKWGVCQKSEKIYTIMEQAKEEPAPVTVGPEEPCGKLKITVFTDADCKNSDAELTTEWQKFWDITPTGKCNDQGSDAGTSFRYACDSSGLHTMYFGDEVCDKCGSADELTWNVCSPQGKIFVIIEKVSTMIV